MADDIVVKVGADASGLNKTLKDVENKTESLADSMAGLGIKAAATFASVAASATIAVKAFNEAQLASNKLTVALQNQGLNAADLSAEYKRLAKEVSAKTGIDDDQLVAAEAQIQALIGQTEVSEELLQAIADLSTQTGSLESAAEQLGLAYQGNTRAFNKQKISIDENASAQERLDQAIAGVTQRFGGQAAVIANTSGSTARLSVAFGDLLENIGENFAPLFDQATAALTAFITQVNESPKLIAFAVGVAEVAAAIAAGIGTAIALSAAMTQLSAAIGVARTAVTALGLSTRAAIGATGIGLLLIIAFEIYDNWSVIWPAIQGVFAGAMAFMVEASMGLTKVLRGIVSRDLEQISEGVDQLKGSLAKGFEVGKTKFEEGTAPKEDPRVAQQKAAEAELAANRKAAADKAEDERARLDELNRAQNENSIQIATLQAQGGSEDLIKLKQAENETLKQLETAKNADLIEALEERLAQQLALEGAAREQAIEEEGAFRNQILAKNTEFNALSVEQKELFLSQNKQQLQAQIETESEARNKIVAAGIKQQIDANNKYLENQQKFGTAYAEINRVVYSTPVTEAQKGFSELSNLQQSNNSTLKSIGKAAAVADITIKTAQSAMNIYTSFTSIPFIGPALGIAGAAAAIAFGGEQIGRVLSAQDGGMVPGFNRGGDSVPSLLQPGELVVPRANFGEVVNAVASQRVQESPAASSGVATGGGSQAVTVSLAFSGDNAEKFLTAKQVEARSLGTLREARA